MKNPMRAAGACLLLGTQFAAASQFTSEVDAILSRATFRNATTGIEIREIDSGDVLYTQNAHLSLTPASNQKLLTSAATLSRLGSNFTYSTTVLASSEPDEGGTLDGDIWLVGSGDPSLTSSRLADLAEVIVEELGVKRITGSIYGDGTVFDRQVLGSGWAWDDEPYYYSAQVAGLNCDLNIVTLSVSPGDATGDAVKVSVSGRNSGEEEYVEIESTATTVSTGQQAGISFDRSRGTNTVTLGGSLATDSDAVTLQVTIENPTSFTAYRFALALEAAGAEVSTAPTKPAKAPSDAIELTVSTSEPMSELLADFLKPSDNLYGEALLKTMGRHANPSVQGSASSGAAAVTDFLDAFDVAASGVYTVDGSGLSRMDTLTAKFVCDLLLQIRGSFSESDWTTYFDALPIGGEDGTLSGRFVGTPVQGNVRAKTGSLTRVSALSGYLSGESGKEYVFSILMNQFGDVTEAREAQDDIVTTLYHL